MRAILSFSILLLMAPGSLAVDYFVAPNGRDDAAGTIDQPFATLNRARDAIRDLKRRGPLTEPVRVVVADGDHALSEPLILEPQDSGSREAPITYEAAPGARPVFSGGRVIAGWIPAEDGLWSTHLPEVAEGRWYFEQLWIDGRRAVRAREPDTYYFHMQDVRQDVIDPGTSPRRPREARQTIRMRDVDFQNAFPEWDPRSLRDINLVVYHKWDITRRFLDGIVPESSLLATSGEGMKSWNPWNRNERFILENYRAALDEPGEWFLGRDGTLLYRPLAHEDMSRASVIAPAVDRFVVIQGRPETGEFVEHVALIGLTFRHAQWLMPPEGFEPAQAAATIGAVIMLDGARNITIRDCEIAHVGTYGVWFRRGCQDCSLIRSNLYDLGAGGVRIGETEIRRTPDEQTHHIRVDNTIIRHGGRIFACAVGVWIGHSGDNAITHNEIADLYYTGISVGWRWGYDESPAKRNAIAFNHVHHIGWGVLSDMGGIYTLGPSEGTVVRNNVFHDIHAYSYGGWGLYTDEGSTGILFENNLVYNTKTGSFHQHYGKENVIRNNLLVDSLLQQLQATRVEEHLSFTFENNIVAYHSGDLLAGPWDRLRHVSRNNCYFRSDGDPIRFLDKTLEEWQAAGHEQGSIIADPRLSEEFHVATDSPAVRLGFVPFDPSEAGLHGDPSWVGKASETAYPPLIVPPPPPPITIREDFEQTPAGQAPAGAEIHVEGKGDAIVVTDETAAEGARSLKIVDAQGLERTFNPHYVYDFERTVMSRSMSVLVWGILGALLLAPVGCFGILVLSISGPSPESVLANAQPVVDRIAVALDEHHRKHGCYPRGLSDLVKQGLLSDLPELPSHWGTSSRYGPLYETNASLDFYRLAFGYHVEGGIGPGDTHWRVLVSDDPEGWKTTGSPDSMENLVAERVLATYRKRHDGKSLDLFVSDVIGKADCDYLYRDRIVDWLGEGAEIVLPPDRFGNGMKGYVYQAQDDTSKRYCFVYKDHWLPLLKSYLPDDERAKHPKRTGGLDDAFVDKNYPVLDKIFAIRESEGRTTWDTVRECPKSPRDKPSGRHEVADSIPGSS